jgi:hypothetical protein
MTHEEKIKVCKEFSENSLGVQAQKGPSYAVNEDALWNFKMTALLLEGIPITKYSSALVLKTKQFLSIVNAIRRNPYAPYDVSEPFETRLYDDSNYSGLIYAMTKEDNGSKGFTYNPKLSHEENAQKFKQFNEVHSDTEPFGHP